MGFCFRQWIEHFQNELGDWLEQREIERKQKEEEEKRKAEELKKQEQIKQEEMNQDEQPGENIFIMPDSLKKTDLDTVFNISSFDWYTATHIDISDGPYRPDMLVTSLGCW